MRLFHTLLPVPECDRGHLVTQMALCGNLHVHKVLYECPVCFRRVSALVQFEENPKMEADAAVRAEVDAQE